MDTHGALETIYRDQSRRVLATLIRLLGGFSPAEEALHDAFLAAAKTWPRHGTPANPYAWLVSAGRNAFIDRRRREQRQDARLADAFPPDAVEPDPAPEAVRDDELRLIFICCHPALAPDGRAALTLREVAGLRTEEIARAFLVPAPTVAQRIVRAKARIRDLALPYELPSRAELAARIDSVLQVIYLIFNEGYSATGAGDLVRADLIRDALRLGQLMAQLTDDAEVLGLLALMTLHDARSTARLDAAGAFVPLEAQDRTLWDAARIDEARALIDRALSQHRAGPYLLQAAIADVHTRAESVETTDWTQIVGLYDTLLRLAPSPVAQLNRAVAVGRRDGPEAGLAAIEAAILGGGLETYHLAFAALADAYAALGRTDDARAAYTRALSLTAQPAERAWLEKRLATV